jgi:hypothetical protein
LKEETKVNCRQVNKKISMLIDGLLSENDKLIALEHLDSCPGCKKLYEDTKEMVGRLNILPVMPLPQGAENRVHFALERQAKKPHKKNWFKFAAIAMPATAAAFAAVLGITYLFSGGLAGTKSTNDALAPKMGMISESEESSEQNSVPESFGGDETFAIQGEQPMEDSDSAKAFAVEAGDGTRSLPIVTEFSVKIIYTGENVEQMNEFVSGLVIEFMGDPEQEVLFDSQKQSAIVLLSIDRYEEFMESLKDYEQTQVGEATYDKDTAYDQNLLFEAIFLFQQQ